MPTVKKYGDDVTVSMYNCDCPSHIDLTYKVECYLPTWVILENHDVTKALTEAHENLCGEARKGPVETAGMRKERPLSDKWTFSTDGVLIMGHNGTPCIGFRSGAEAQTHASNKKTWKDDLVRHAVAYAVLPTVHRG